MFRPWSATKRVHVRIPGSRWLSLLGGALIVGSALALAPLSAIAATAPRLGTDTSFAVLAASTVTNTGPTSITGDLGLSPGSSVTGFPPGQVNGATHVDDAVAVGAKRDLSTAYDDAFAAPCTATLTGVDLGGLTLIPGVYCFATSAQLTGTLTLNGLGDPNGVFIFKTGSTLTTASSSKVAIINGGPCGVFWQIGSSATLGTDTSFVGTLLVNTSITMNTRATILPGRALAGAKTPSGAVTLDSNIIQTPPNTCTTPSSSTTTTLTTSPNPSTVGTPVRLAATVRSAAIPPATPVGSVTFLEGTTTLGTAPLDTTGNTTFTTPALAPGSHTVRAVYPGAAGSSKAPGFLPSASQVVVQDVTPAPAPAPSPSPGSPGLPSTGHPPGP